MEEARPEETERPEPRLLRLDKEDDAECIERERPSDRGLLESLLDELNERVEPWLEALPIDEFLIALEEPSDRELPPLLIPRDELIEVERPTDE